jgi:hypothetical protein
MPKVPERKLSLGEQLAKQTRIRNKYSESGTQDFAVVEIEETRSGTIKTARLSPFKCSKCFYIGNSGLDIKRHWSEEH